MARIVTSEEKRTIHGDIEEVFSELEQKMGHFRARCWYWFQVFSSMQNFIKNSIIWSAMMLRNTLKVTLRNLRKYKGYSFINIIGLALGLTCFFTIMLFVFYELSYDRYHEKADQIYRVAVRGNANQKRIHTPLTMNPLGPALGESFPEVVRMVRFRNLGPRIVEYQAAQKRFYEGGLLFADSSLFEMFTFPLIKGNPKTALRDPYSVVINQEVAEKYFGSDDPMGKTLRYNDSYDLHITGVMENVPENSHFHPRILISYTTLYDRVPNRMDIWLSLNYYTYLLLTEQADPVLLEEKLPALLEKNMGDIMQQFGVELELYLQPLKDIHLGSNLMAELEENLDMTYIHIFMAVAFFILLIAGINFVNLSTARSANRAKEVGLRKVVGAVRTDIMRQFLSESVVMSLMAFILSLFLLKLLLPLFGSISGRTLPNQIFQDFRIFGILFCIVLLVGVVSGGYPAFVLSAFRPIKVLRGNLRSGARNGVFRSILVVFQFSISIILIIGAFVILGQIRYIKNKELGFDKEHLVVIPMGSQHYETVSEQLKSLPGVMNVTAVSQLPGFGMSVDVFYPEGLDRDQPWAVNYLAADYDILKTLDTEVVQGRPFSSDFETDAENAILINETAVRDLGWDQPVGKKIDRYFGSDEKRSLTVVGVFKDYHYSSLREPIGPFFIYYDSNQFSNYLIRISSNAIPVTLALIKKQWAELEPSLPVVYSFLDERIDLLYRSEYRLSKIFQSFTFLAIVIACLGLFGLASYTAERCTKEIGIRKVLGASISGIVFHMSKEFIRWVLVANLIAWPVAYILLKA